MKGTESSPGDDEIRNAITAKALILLMGIRGVLLAKPLDKDGREQLLLAEAKSEERVVLGMCLSYNKGVREALGRDISIAIVINSSEFIYPHEPHMRMLYNDEVVGEEVYDDKRAAELRSSRNNTFLWDNFVVYRDRLPRDRAGREKMCITYLPRKFPELMEIEGIHNSVFAEPSMDGDMAVKNLLSFTSTDPVMGTCVVGFNIKRELSNI
jgi:hypothetical protein